MVPLLADSAKYPAFDLYKSITRILDLILNFRHRALTVSLATAGMELTDTLELRAKTPPRPLQLPGLPTKVFVYATGAGCATVQV